MFSQRDAGRHGQHIEANSHINHVIEITGDRLEKAATKSA